MATGETSTRWIDHKCKKHTPAETRKWIKESWTKSVLPEFKKFRAAIADTTNDIPKDFFVTNGIGKRNQNPLFLFLRPSKVLYIALALEGDCNPKLHETLWLYIREWHNSVEDLKCRLSGNQAVSRFSHSLQHLAAKFRSLHELISDDCIDEKWYDKYKDDVYQKACNDFSDIPTQAASTQQIIDVIKEKLKESSEKMPTRRKRKTISDEAKARKAEIREVVKIIRQKGDGTPKWSVTKALNVLGKMNQYKDIVRSLSVNSWKKYVATYRKSIRGK